MQWFLKHTFELQDYLLKLDIYQIQAENYLFLSNFIVPKQ
jgi:hypothetical protein